MSGERRGRSRDDEPNGGLWLPKVVRASDIERRQREWLWRHRIVIGGINLLAGMPDQGKSLLGIDIAAAVSRGRRFPDADGCFPLGSVIILSAEDDPATTIAPRLDAADADTSKIHLLNTARYFGPEGATDERLIQLDQDIGLVESAADALGDCKLIVIDPISAYMGEADDHKNAAVRGVLAKLSDLASRQRLAVLLVSHLRKAIDPHASNRIMGSLAYVALSRIVWLAMRHTVDDGSGKPLERRIIALVKGNLTPQRTGLEYEITRPHSDHDEPHIEWFEEPIELTADEALAEPAGKPGPKPARKCAALEWLREYLANGSRPTAEIESAAEAAGHNAAALKRAKKELGVLSFRKTPTGPWFWRLPPEDQDANCALEHDQLGHLEHLDGNGADFDTFEVPKAPETSGDQDAHMPEGINVKRAQSVAVDEDEWGTVE
jgi:hypothetical protein